MNDINEKTTETEKKLFTPVLWITSLICLLPIALGFILYDRLPQDIPQQYSWNNQVNWTLPKPWGFIICPVLLLLINFALHLSIKLTKQNINKKVELITQWIICLIGLPVNAMMILLPAGFGMDAFHVVAPVLAVMFIILGNYLPKVENNGIVGVRAPWTRKNSAVWAKNQRFTGKLFVIIGFFILITCFTSIGKYAMVAGIAVLVIIPLVYSLLIAGKYSEKDAE